ncbi:MAG: ABC transporter permease [Planctomycetota bacterium]|nr:ABC transporter permease [Planctomycetota bacterium]
MIKNITALTQRELVSSFFSPVAYVTTTLFLVFTGVFFLRNTLVAGSEASMRPFLDNMAWILVVAMPLLTMRVLSDEFASGTIETLMTAPVTDVEVVLSKFLGVLVFYTVLLLTTVVHVALLFAYGGAELGVVLYGYVGMLLLGALYVSVGVFASALTKYQLVAAFIAMAVLAAFTLLVDWVARTLGGPWRTILGFVNILRHFDDFSKGIFDTRAVIFFLSATAFFLFLAVKVLESRRWR